MTEHIEKWKEEFIDIVKRKNNYWNCMWYTQKEKFQNPQVNFAWEIFLTVKRNQRVVELPKPNMCYDMVADYYEKLTESLTAAGIPYKIKGE